MIEFAIAIALYLTCVIAGHVDQRTMSRARGSGRTGNPRLVRDHRRAR